MKITFESGEGSLEVEPDSTEEPDHSAFLADLVSPGGLRFPDQRPPSEVAAANDMTHERVEALAEAGHLAVRAA